jgi:hypothetical protein
MRPVIHEVRFPRFHDDVMSEKRTLFHSPIDTEASGVPKVGDGLRLLAAPNFPRCKIGNLIDVRQVRLLDELGADLVKLCAGDRAEYLARWDALHPDLPSADNPVVWRIEFRYGMWESDPTDPPEWSLAS